MKHKRPNSESPAARYRARRRALERGEPVPVWARTRKSGPKTTTKPTAEEAAFEEARLRTTPTFRCAKCGGVFALPDGFATRGARSFVRLGGRIVCEKCAAARFRRRVNFDAELHPDTIR